MQGRGVRGSDIVPKGKSSPAGVIRFLIVADGGKAVGLKGRRQPSFFFASHEAAEVRFPTKKFPLREGRGEKDVRHPAAFSGRCGKRCRCHAVCQQGSDGSPLRRGGIGHPVHGAVPCPGQSGRS